MQSVLAEAQSAQARRTAPTGVLPRPVAAIAPDRAAPGIGGVARRLASRLAQRNLALSTGLALMPLVASVGFLVEWIR